MYALTSIHADLIPTFMSDSYLHIKLDFEKKNFFDIETYMYDMLQPVFSGDIEEVYNPESQFLI